MKGDGVPDGRPLAIAHRAGNDLTLLRTAEALDADYLECDVWLYQGRMEVRHEKTLGPLPVRWDRWKLEWKGPPRLVLEQLLEAWRGPGRLLLDLKGTDGHLPADVLRAVGEAGKDIRFGVTARTWALLEPFAEMPGVATFPSAGSMDDVNSLIAMGSHPHWSGIAVHQRVLSGRLVEQLHDLAPLVTTWPINTLAAYEKVRGYGVDGITSDNLRVIAHVLRSRGQGGKRQR